MKKLVLLLSVISFFNCSDNTLEQFEEIERQNDVKQVAMVSQVEGRTSVDDVDEVAVWDILRYKFEMDLPLVFSKLDESGWISHFVQDRVVSINDYTSEEEKITTFYTGGFFGSVWNTKLPASILAKVFFRRLKSSGYLYTRVKLLGITIKDANHVDAQIFFERFNTSRELMSTSYGLYKLENVEGEWGISEMNLYPNTDETRAFFSTMKTFKGLY
ncbi:hypothetical protein [Tenacibaculum maritimum]|uniref:hypothetical protein n=1 Tax=Tenacibaculum maritimum TaxID=107401 RepID=UPI0012E428E8|nr:hypothetical protein [Tenacibaculum maritimum]MCD9584843.1 hypothetical protein [Tenacibaculum maritimum]MCD9620709.1 hypothetical protein [Tenacibaculum maritimum]MCD9626950.1 hypothetical protein [Tenacibaculum maritimum]MCD9630475.1 hypothetical protein [Tenacibaculum maritimum]MCD9632674.1 hypothetical protein [Tenacibaculum maritimum]